MRGVTVEEYGDGIEAVGPAELAVCSDPGAGGELEVAALLAGDGFEGVPEAAGSAGPDLDERDDVAAACDEVDLLVAPAPVPVQYGPSGATEQLCGGGLGPAAELVSTCHASKVARVAGRIHG